ncbi:MAG: TRAP transporter small permease [Hyphomicrobiales bacterium]
MHKSEEPPVFLQKMNAVYDVISRVCVFLAGTAIVVMTVIFAWLVFGRYVLNDTPTWVEQVSLLLIMVIAFLGAAAGVNNNTHLSVNIFRSIVPAWLRTIFVIATDTAMMVFGGMMFWYGIQLTQFKWGTLIPLINLPEGLRSLPLTLCGLFVFLFSAGHLIRLFLGHDQREDTIE